MRLALVLLLLTLCACSSEMVRLRNPKTGESVKCGPYSYWPSIIAAEVRARACVNDYKDAGYVRHEE